jgi:hypothetical protein
LQDGHLAQPRVEPALEADERGERTKRARAVRAVHERAHQIDVAGHQVLVFRRQVRFVEIG